MNRRRFLESLTLPALLGGCSQFDLEQGLFNECRDPLAGDLASTPLVKAAWSGLRPDRVWDVHVHLVGNGRSQSSGIYVDPDFEGGWSPASRARHAFFQNAACAGKDESQLDQLVVARLGKQVDAMPPGVKLMLLAFDYTYDEKGGRRADQTTFSTPNDYAQRVAKSKPDRFEWIASVHPYREDAIDALAKVKEGGARAIKWLPPSMGIDMSSPRCMPYFDALVRLGIPLLVHLGEEKAVHGAGRGDLANPLHVRTPLERGVRVIAAHCASLGKSPDLESKSRKEVENYELFARLMQEKRYDGRLFGDISAVTQANRAGVLPKLLSRQDWAGRLLNGSDFPLPGILPLFSLGTLVKEGVLDAAALPTIRELRQTNSLLFDFVLKRTLSYQGSTFPVSAFETRGFFERAGSLPTQG